MSRISTVRTNLGVVTLHHKRGRFFTRSTWVDATGKKHVQRIPQDAASAWDWYRYCAERGHCRKEFPLEGEA